MSNSPTIKMLGSNEAEIQWWIKLLPIERSGRKWVIHRKKMFGWLGGSVVLLATAQIIANTNDIDSQLLSGIHSPDSPTLNGSQIISEAPLLGNQPSTVNKQLAQPRANKLVGLEIISRPRNLSSIPPGSIMEAKLISGASNGMVRAEVSKPLEVNGEVIIPVGSYLVGGGSSSEERLFIRFTQVVFRDGSFGNLVAEACDLSDKIVGLKGSKIGNKSLQLAGSIGLGFLGGFSTALQDREGQQGTSITKASLKNALLNGTANTAFEESKNMMSDLKNRVPVIEVPEGTVICAISGGMQ